MLVLDLQLFLEAQPLDRHVPLDELQFVIQRDARLAARLEHGAQQVAERDHGLQCTRVLLEPYQRGDGVERVEQEMRLQGAREGFEPGLGELPLQFEWHPVGCRPGAGDTPARSRRRPPGCN